MQKTIGLRIKGNPSNQGGFSPLIIKGVIEKDIIQEDRSLPISDSPAICLCHKNDQVLFLLLDNNVVPSDGGRDGTLSILLSLPKNHAIKDGVSPYSLLMEVYQFFINNCMTDVEGTAVKRFKALDVIQGQNDACRAILDKYELESTAPDYVPMSPESVGATLYVPKNKLEGFFCDTQYPEFRPYKEIYVSSQDSSAERLANLEIPRDKQYEIWLNGEMIRPKGKLLPTSRINSVGLNDTEDYKYDRIDVTLQELQMAEGNKIQNGQSSVQLDMKMRKIEMNVPRIDIRYALEFKWEGDSNGIKQLKQDLQAGGSTKLKVGLDDISMALFMPNPQIKPSVTKQALKFQGVDDKYTATARMTANMVDKKAVITIKVEKKAVLPPVGGGGNPMNGNMRTSSMNGQMYHEPEKKSNKKLFLGLLFGLILGLIIGFVVGYYIPRDSEEETEEICEGDRNSKQQSDDKNKDEKKDDAKASDDNSEDNNQKGDKEGQKNDEPTDDKIKSEEQKEDKKEEPVAEQPTKAELIAEIQNRKNFPEFMNLVNELKYSKCEEHPIFKELQKIDKTYTYAIYNVCKPEKKFKKLLDENPKRKTVISKLPPRYEFKTLDEIKKESDRIASELKKIK